MTTDAKKIVSQGRELWSRLPPRRRLAAVAALVGTAALLWTLAGRAPATRWAVLFSGLAPEDAGDLVEHLRAEHVPYRVDHGGATLSVPEARVHELRIAMASQGLPRGGGVGFEVFDKQSFGATSFVEQMNYRRALQGELARTIGSLEAVERARVHVALGERSLYRKDDEPPSASVVLRLRRGRGLDRAQVRGIVNLVAASVEGLSAERVTVVDETGKVLSSPGDDAAEGDEARVALERQLERRIEELLAPVVGAGHFEVAVAAELDRTQIERTEELWDKDREALRSESRTVESPGGLDQLAAGVAGVRGNLPGAPAPTESVAPGGISRLQETRNYEVNRTVSRTVGPKVRIKRLHVAVLVDGKLQGEGDARAVVARSADELAQIGALVREAAGLDPERGDRVEVQSVPFAPAAGDAPEPAAASAWPLPVPPRIALPAAAALLLIGVTVILLARRRRRRRARGAAPELLPSLPLRVGELEEAMHKPAAAELGAGAAPLGLPGRSPRDRAIDAARHDTERAALVLQAWLAEPSTAEPAGAGGKP
jgi:flagellar M-ring protein FliF